MALAAVMGCLVLDLLVLPREAGELAVARRRLRMLSAIAVAVLMVATAGELLARTRTMSGGDLAGVRAALPLVLTRTHFGTIWMARVAALCLLLLFSLLPSPSARATGLLLALGVTLTTSLTGHAADWGDRSFTVLVDWSHAVDRRSVDRWALRTRAGGPGGPTVVAPGAARRGREALFETGGILPARRRRDRRLQRLDPDARAYRSLDDDLRSRARVESRSGLDTGIPRGRQPVCDSPRIHHGPSAGEGGAVDPARAARDGRAEHPPRTRVLAAVEIRHL